MPVPVNSVPNPWTPYMDGRLWEFTTEEWDQMRNPYRPMTNAVTGEMMGYRQIIWGPINGHMYTRFFLADMPINEADLAGWKVSK